MALRLLGTKISKRILPIHGPLKGLRPLHAWPNKTAVISSPVEDSVFAPAARATRMSYHQASCSRPCSPWKALPGSSFFQGKRNFASSLAPSITEDLLKMNSFKKNSSGAAGDKKCPKVEAVERCECDYCSSLRDIDKFLVRFQIFGTLMLCIGLVYHVWTVREILRLQRMYKALDDDDDDH